MSTPLRALAEFWTGGVSSHGNGMSNAAAAPQFAETCKTNADKCGVVLCFEDLDPRVVVSIEELLRVAEPLTRHILFEEISHAISIYSATESLSAINDLAIFLPLITSFKKPRFFINGLTHHPQFSKTHGWFDNASPELLEQALAVLLFTVQLDETEAVLDTSYLSSPDPTDDRQVYVDDPSMVDLIVGTPHQVGDIISIVRSNPTIPVELVKEMIHSDQKALRDGLL